MRSAFRARRRRAIPVHGNAGTGFRAVHLLDLWPGNVAALGTALLGAVLAAFFAFASIDIFLKLTRRLSLLPFVIYRIGLGAAILLVM